MRIIGGKYKGQRLYTPKGDNTRPTSDQIRESIFNVLAHGIGIDFKEMIALDLFAGSGALGFEAFSRGAKKITFFEKATPAIEIIKINGKKFKENHRFSICQRDASFLPARSHREDPGDLVFLDPPYRNDLITPTLMTLRQGDWLKVGAVLVAEMAIKDHYGLNTHYSLTSERIYGNTKVAFISYNGVN